MKGRAPQSGTALCRECKRSFRTTEAAEAATVVIGNPAAVKELLKGTWVRRYGERFFDALCGTCIRDQWERWLDDNSWHGDELTDEEEHYGRRNDE